MSPRGGTRWLDPFAFLWWVLSPPEALPLEWCLPQVAPRASSLGSLCGGSRGRVLARAECGVFWKLGEEEGFFPGMFCSFWLLGKVGVTLLSIFLVSYCKARKKACGLRQCQAPLWSPANCKEEGWNQNRKGKTIRSICSLPFFLGGLHLPTEQLLSSPVPPHCVYIEFIHIGKDL